MARGYDRRQVLKLMGASGASLTLAGCMNGGGNGADGGDGGDGDGGNGGGANEVMMVTEGSDYYFDPIGLHVEPGTTVTFVNDSGTHSSTAYSSDNGKNQMIPDGASSWDSGLLSESGATFDHTFETEGTYNYYCTPHETLGMVARIVVGEPGGPGEEATPQNGPSTGQFPPSDVIVDQGSVAYPYEG